MKKTILAIIGLLAGTAIISAQSFEGTIEFRKKTQTDTVNYVYHIKGDHVRLDEIGNRSGNVEGSFIIDLQTKQMLSLSHARKKYIEQGSGLPAKMNGKADVKETGNSKTLHGSKCKEYVVTNSEEKVKVTYWMAEGHYDFFFKLLQVLNRKDKSAVYIQELKGVDGMFPFLSVQQNLETGKDEVIMEVTGVEKKKVDDSMFKVPSDYQKFQK